MWDFDPTELHLMLETKEDLFPLEFFEKSSFEPYPDIDYQEHPTELPLMLETKEDNFPLDIFEKSAFEP